MTMSGVNLTMMTGPAEKQSKLIPSDSIDMIITSPPYDNVRDYNGHTFGLRTFKTIAKEAYRVLKPGGVMIWVVNDQTENGQESGTSFEQALYFRNKIRFKLYDTMIYRRSNPPLTHRRYEQAFEFMFVLVKGNKGPTTFNGLREPKEYPESKPRKKGWHRWPDGSFKKGTNNTDDTRLCNNVWWYGKHGAEEKCAHEHPAIYPEQLAHDQIYTWSNEGDTVLDLFCGSGTTAKVAVSMGRKFIGIEISPEYVALTKRRISEFITVEWGQKNEDNPKRVQPKKEESPAKQGSDPCVAERGQVQADRSKRSKSSPRSRRRGLCSSGDSPRAEA